MLVLLVVGTPASCQGDEARGTPDAATVTEGVAEAPPQSDAPRGFGHVRGAAEAPVTVVEFSDFGCPFCARFANESYPELHRDFVETGQVRWVFVPFFLGTFPNGELAARSGVCAGQDGGPFQAMKSALYARQAEWKAASAGAAPDLFQEMAVEAGLDPEAFTACLAGESAAERIRVNSRLAASSGVRATPSFLVNGRLVEGALPAAQFRMVLESMASQNPHRPQP
jgi:protein-disulfide isomerase